MNKKKYRRESDNFDTNNKGNHKIIATSSERTSDKSSNSKISRGTSKTSAKIVCSLETKSTNGLNFLQLMPICSLLETTLLLLPSHTKVIWDLRFASLCGNAKFFFLTLYGSLEL